MTAAGGRPRPAVDGAAPGPRWRLLVITAALSGLVTGCGGSSSRSAPGGPPPSSSPLPSPAATAAPTAAAPTAAAPAAGPSRPVPGPSPGQVLVQRPDAVAPAQRLRAPAVPFDAPARYSDGVVLAVRDVRHAVVSDTGPGALPGQAVTTLVVEASNGSRTPLELSGVVMSVTVGPDRTPADPVYGGEQEDFSGILEPGARTSAVYSFAIPARARGAVTLTMDMDGRHAPAVWRGAVV